MFGEVIPMNRDFKSDIRNFFLAEYKKLKSNDFFDRRSAYKEAMDKTFEYCKLIYIEQPAFKLNEEILKIMEDDIVSQETKTDLSLLSAKVQKLQNEALKDLRSIFSGLARKKVKYLKDLWPLIEMYGEDIEFLKKNIKRLLKNSGGKNTEPASVHVLGGNSTLIIKGLDLEQGKKDYLHLLALIESEVARVYGIMLQTEMGGAEKVQLQNAYNSFSRNLLACKKKMEESNDLDQIIYQYQQIIRNSVLNFIKQCAIKNNVALKDRFLSAIRKD
jgi:hypothetical protein